MFINLFIRLLVLVLFLIPAPALAANYKVERAIYGNVQLYRYDSGDPNVIGDGKWLRVVHGDGVDDDYEDPNYEDTIYFGLTIKGELAERAFSETQAIRNSNNTNRLLYKYLVEIEDKACLLEYNAPGTNSVLTMKCNSAMSEYQAHINNLGIFRYSMPRKAYFLVEHNITVTAANGPEHTRSIAYGAATRRECYAELRRLEQLSFTP